MISRRTLLSLPLVAAAAAGVPFRVAAGPRDRSLVICLSLQPEALDPTSSAAAVIGEVVHANVFEGLTRIEENGRVGPLLARSWSLSDDQLRYRFQLRPDVRFHDGSSLDAAVVVYSIERAKALGHANKLAATFANIAAVRAVDAQTVELVLHHADAFLPFRLGEPPAVILHPDSAARAAHAPIGTGPYRLTRRPGGDIDLQRWEAFREPERIRIDQATFRFIPDPERQVQEVMEGRVDMLFRAAPTSIGRFEASREYEVLSGSSSGKGMVAINHRRAPLNDVRIRRALTHAIDREAFIREVLHGRGRAIGSHFVPTDPNYVNLTAVHPYDPEQARALLREAGVRTPLELDLTLPPTPYALAGGPVIARALQAVGIRIRLVRVSWAEWMSGVFQGRFDLSLILHVEPLDYAIYTQPDYYFGYDSPVFRSLVAQHAAAVNPRQHGRLFRQIQRHLANDAVNAWIFTPESISVVRKGLNGVPMDYPVVTHDVGAMYWG
ncbi:ABC transporter substrate-binding protein [Castellaniella ginsengisoli]|uniref:ABC transporter substrate-binding protein n=1 Tax=Castellaniella ginsengisoli TaxID=546114 RepID=A0AB39CIY9_9BURK